MGDEGEGQERRPLKLAIIGQPPNTRSMLARTEAHRSEAGITRDAIVSD